MTAAAPLIRSLRFMIISPLLDEVAGGGEDLVHGHRLLERGRERVAADQVGQDRGAPRLDPGDGCRGLEDLRIVDPGHLAVVGRDAELLEDGGRLRGTWSGR